MGLRRYIYNHYNLLLPPGPLDNIIPNVTKQEIIQGGLSIFPKVT